MEIIRSLQVTSCFILLCSSKVYCEMALANVTRSNSGDFYTITGTDCGPTRCMEASHGTAMNAIGSTLGACVCQCRQDYPTFRDDSLLCVNSIEECPMATFGRDQPRPSIPFVFLPLKGQIIYPSKEIIFTDVENSICAVTSAQYLSKSGWVTLRDIVDNDVPFGLYRDEGKTFLQWRGSTILHNRLEGRLVVAHVVCSAPPRHVATPCAVFRVAGSASPIMLDIRSIPFAAGETITPDPVSFSNQKISVLESLSIGFCALMLIFIYTAGIVFYIHFKKRQKKKGRSSSNTLSTDNGSINDSRLELDNLNIKTNPLLSMDPYGVTLRPEDFLHDSSALSDVSERTEETLDPPSSDIIKKVLPKHRQSQVVTALVHNSRKTKPVIVHHTLKEKSPPLRYLPIPRRTPSPDADERRPASEVAIVDDNAAMFSPPPTIASSSLRRKLYFNPVFFEPDHLRNPPPAAKEFLVKIREVMSVAKEKMTAKRFLPILNAIPEEEYYRAIDFNLSPARCGRRMSVVSLKRENSRRRNCAGCPGCATSAPAPGLARSSSCRACVSDDRHDISNEMRHELRQDMRQRIVRDWLADVPAPIKNLSSHRSVAKVSGTPRAVQPKKGSNPRTPPPVIKIDESTSSSPSSSRGIRRSRKKMPPPPPPPTDTQPLDELDTKMPVEIKKKMEAVIKELNRCRLAETKVLEEQRTETTLPIVPRVVINVVAAETISRSQSIKADFRPITRVAMNDSFEADSLERNARKRRFSLAYGDERLFSSASSSPSSEYADRSLPISEVFVDPPVTRESPTPGALTIRVQGSPEPENEKLPSNEDFDPDTLDRKLMKSKSKFTPPLQDNRRVDKIQLRSCGSFKMRSSDFTQICDEESSPPVARSIGSLRQIYEAKAKAAAKVTTYEYKEPALFTKLDKLCPPDLLLQIGGEPKPPLPPKQSRSSRNTPGNSPEEGRRDVMRFRYSERYRKSARKPRQRQKSPSRRGRPEDSGYLSTDSNESKRRSKFVLRLKAPPPIIGDSDTEGSACDGRSESGGESVETSSVLFGRFGPQEDGAPDSGFAAQDSDCDRSIVSVVSIGRSVRC